jgi:hypothetical protein
MQSTPLQRPICPQYWNIFEEFSHESSTIDKAYETRFQDVLKQFQKIITPRLMGNSILDKGKIFGTPTVIKLVTSLLTEINFTLFPNTKSILSPEGKKGWSLSWEADFNFDDLPRIRERKPNEMNEESLRFDDKGRNNVIIHLSNNLKEVKMLDSGFIKGGSVQMIGRLMNRDCDFDREFEVLINYFEIVEKFEDRGDECYGFITDIFNWTFFKYCYKTNLLLRSDSLSVDIDDILEGREISKFSMNVMKILPSIIMRLLQGYSIKC